MILLEFNRRHYNARPAPSPSRSFVARPDWITMREYHLLLLPFIMGRERAFGFPLPHTGSWVSPSMHGDEHSEVIYKEVCT